MVIIFILDIYFPITFSDLMYDIYERLDIHVWGV